MTGGGASEGEDPTSAAGQGALARYATCESDEEVGGFEAELQARFTSVEGSVFAGVKPAVIPEAVVMSADGCTLYEPVTPFCEPACGLGMVCAEGDMCLEEPAVLDAGNIHVTGMKEDVQLTQRPTNSYTNPTLPHPAFEAGDDIRLEASGGPEVEPFVLRGFGVEPLVLADREVRVERDAPVELAWTPQADAGPIRVQVTLTVNAHGGAAASIECEVEDSGSHQIPTELVNALMDYGLTGFPELSFVRLSSDATSVGHGCVRFAVQTRQEVEPMVQGVISCDGPTCPDGMTCDLDTFTCQ